MYRYVAITDVGPQYKVNDDRILIGNNIVDNGMEEGCEHNPHIIAAVCDGVGGLSLGYEAAEETLRCLMSLNVPAVDRGIIRNVIETANRKVKEHQAVLNSVEGMRTTLVALYLNGQTMYVINAGDSRLYRYRDKKLEQLSKDHSVVQNMLDVGEITPEEARVHPKRNVITKCIGDEERVNARIIDFSDDVKVNDLFMLCSDGISDNLSNEEMALILAENPKQGLTVVCKRMIDKSIDNGATDNISICLIQKEN